METLLERLKKDLRDQPYMLENGDEIPVMDVLYGCYCESLQIVDRNQDIRTAKRNAFKCGIRVGMLLTEELTKILY